MKNYTIHRRYCNLLCWLIHIISDFIRNQRDIFLVEYFLHYMNKQWILTVGKGRWYVVFSYVAIGWMNYRDSLLIFWNWNRPLKHRRFFWCSLEFIDFNVFSVTIIFKNYMYSFFHLIIMFFVLIFFFFMNLIIMILMNFIITIFLNIIKVIFVNWIYIICMDFILIHFMSFIFIIFMNLIELLH